MYGKSILAVMDGAADRRDLVRGLEDGGYQVATVQSPREAESAIRRGSFSVVVADISSPEMDTLNFLSYFKDKNPVGKIIMVSRKPEFASAVQSLRLSATDYLFDPVTCQALAASVDKAIFESDMAIARMRLYAAEENLRLKDELENAYIETITALANALEARDKYTRGHSTRVAEMAVRVGERMRIGAEDIRRLRYGGMLHDIGKIGVDKAILNKKSQLSAEEFTDVYEHTEIGARIIGPVASLKGILPMIKYHHEPFEHLSTMMDKKSREFLLVSIIKAVDAFDAMVSDRPYRRALPADMALTELRHYAGTSFHPQVVEEIEKIVRGDTVRELKTNETPMVFGRGDLAQGLV